jgi:hypothetical protein
MPNLVLNVTQNVKPVTVEIQITVYLVQIKNFFLKILAILNAQIKLHPTTLLILFFVNLVF